LVRVKAPSPSARSRRGGHDDLDALLADLFDERKGSRRVGDDDVDRFK